MKPRAKTQCPVCHMKRCECKRKRRPIRYTDRRRIAELLAAEGPEFEKKAKRFRHCHMPYSAEPGKPAHPGGEVLVCPDNHVESAKYHPYNCGVVGCPLCSRFASIKLKGHYQDSMIALYLAREQTSWHGRFWFLTVTYKVDEGESAEKAMSKFRSAVPKLCDWILAEYGRTDGDGFTREMRAILRQHTLAREGRADDALPFDVAGGGYVGTIETGSEGLEKSGSITQIHAHIYIAVPSETQISRWVGKVRHGLLVGSTFDLAGDKRKETIERKFCELVDKETPISRIYEIAPRGLAFKFDRAELEKRLADLGQQGDELAKSVKYNMRATIASASSEILKYATKAYNLKPEAFVEVVKAFHGRRRAFSGGAFYGGRRRRLVDFFKAYKAQHGDPLGRQEKPAGCPVCGKARRRLTEAYAREHCPEILAAALRGYLAARRWLDTGTNSPGAPPQIAARAGPPWLYHYLADLEGLPAPQRGGKQAQQGDRDPAGEGEALPVRVAPGVLAYSLGLGV